jgi:hypothetical protein
MALPGNTNINELFRYLNSSDRKLYFRRQGWALPNIPPTIQPVLFAHTLTPPHTSENLVSLGLALRRLRNPPGGNNLECYVSSWGTTAIHRIYSGANWVITPENRDSQSNKIPDLVIEDVVQGQNNQESYLQPHLVCEYKKKGGASLMDAMGQLSESVTETLSSCLYGSSEAVYKVYAYVQRGQHAAIFEYHSNASDLTEEGVPNVVGFVPLTLPYYLTSRQKVKSVYPAPYPPPEGLLLLSDTVGANFDPYSGAHALERREGIVFNEPCVFDITSRSHRRHLLNLLKWSTEYEPRPSIHPDDDK